MDVPPVAERPRADREDLERLLAQARELQRPAQVGPGARPLTEAANSGPNVLDVLKAGRD
ncbi:hypothetical protein [Streptomyces sp. S063]|uniref:hypothetical protein n=1 Tax=Streptomyces sp. S063 TaxID=2005885 RepID=UPI0019D13067|nr:hypothetical protein [Streptomyces sp. S063]